MHQMPFYANYKYHIKLDLLNISHMDNLAAKDLPSRLLELQETMKLHLQKAQDYYKTSMETLRKESLPFKVGEKVWRNIITTQPCNKLDYHCLGPFPILKQINLVAF